MPVPIVLGAPFIHFVLHNGTKASKGGVEPPVGDRDTRRRPPLESVEKRS